MTFENTQSSIMFKRAAIHNIRITTTSESVSDVINEGLVIPKSILEACDILPFEQIIVTNIRGKNWDNRVISFAVPGLEEGVVAARGSLRHFLREGDLICIITRSYLDSDHGLKLFEQDKLAIMDLGFEPNSNLHNFSKDAVTRYEYGSKKQILNAKIDEDMLLLRQKMLPRVLLSNLLLDLEIVKTHPDCLQGSAEIPGDIMQAAKLNRYQGVQVFNASQGGVAETYAVPMPPGIVMTTGAMANFAPIGTIAHVASFTMGFAKSMKPRILKISNNADIMHVDSDGVEL